MGHTISYVGALDLIPGYCIVSWANKANKNSYDKYFCSEYLRYNIQRIISFTFSQYLPTLMRHLYTIPKVVQYLFLSTYLYYFLFFLLVHLPQANRTIEESNTLKLYLLYLISYFQTELLHVIYVPSSKPWSEEPCGILSPEIFLLDPC